MTLLCGETGRSIHRRAEKKKEQWMKVSSLIDGIQRKAARAEQTDLEAGMEHTLRQIGEKTKNNTIARLCEVNVSPDWQPEDIM